MKAVYSISLFLLAILCPSITHASHAQGADLSYQFVSYDSTTGVTSYIVTATFYRDCSGIPAPNPMVLSITNAACSGGSYSTAVNLPLINGLPCPYGGVSGASGCEVSHLCNLAMGQSTCNSGSGAYPGMQKYVYSGTVSLPGTGTSHLCSKWLIYVDISARNQSTNLATGGDLYIEAVINNSIDPLTGQPYHNNSPVFQNDPVPFACINSSGPLEYNNAGVDADGDSLVYSLVYPLQFTNSPLTFSPGYSVNSPIMSSIPCNLDSNTGILTYKPMQAEVDALAFLVKEYRNGILVGSTMRDVQIKILNCNEAPPSFGPVSAVQGAVFVDSVTITGCPGDHLIADVPVTTSGFSNIILLSSIDQFPTSFSGMTFTQNGTGSSVTARIEWLNVDTVCRYVYIKATSDDCPVTSSTYRAIKICGNKHVGITPTSAVYCGQPITLTASGGNNPVWTPAAGISSVNTFVTQVSPAVSTWYRFSSDCANDSVLVRVSNIITTHITHDTILCNGSSLQLNEAASGAGLFTYLWVPATGLSNNTIPNPVVSSNLSAIYHCITTDTSGCVLDDSVKVTVRGGGHLTLTADTLVAAGGQTQLHASLTSNYAVCVTIPENTVTEQTQVQVGTGTSVQGGTGFAYPSPFGNYYRSARHQMLFKASELTALFGSSKIISSISLDIGVLNSGATLDDFTVRLGCVNVDSLIQYEGGNSMSTVLEDSSYTPHYGWNTLAFTNAYAWDGVSDLVVDLCFTNTTLSNINNKMRYTPTPFRSLWFTYSNGYSVCGVSGTQPQSPTYATFFQRPNVKFGLADVTGGVTGFQWQPSTGINAVSNPSAFSTSATVHTDQWYTASYTDSVCPEADSILVHINVPSQHVAIDTSICLGDSVLFIAYHGAAYSWSDGSNVLSTNNYFYYSSTHSGQVILLLTDSLGGLSTDTSHVTILDQRVWPGDVNDDHVVDNSDILYLGIAYGNTGPVRPNATQQWAGQCTIGWDSVFVNGTNYAHADCNGDGATGYDDTLAVYSNWGLTHAKTHQDRQSNYNLAITTDKAHYDRHEVITASVWAGDINNVIPDMYGIAYRFDFTSVGSVHIISVDQSMSWIDRKLDFRKMIAGSAYLAQSRINHRDTSGYGKIAEIKLMVDGATSLSDSLYLNAGNVLALNRRGDTVNIGAASQAVTISSAGVGVTEISSEHLIDIYPNPNNGTFRVMQSDQERVVMTVNDAIGRQIYTRVLTDKSTNIDLSTVPEGIYIATFSGAGGKSSKRVVITK